MKIISQNYLNNFIKSQISQFKKPKISKISLRKNQLFSKIY